MSFENRYMHLLTLRKIRDDEDYWHSVEGYISTHTNSRFSHGICPDRLASEYEPCLRSSYTD